MTTQLRGRGRGESKSSPRRVRAILRDGDAAELYLRDNLTYQQIADRCGYGTKGDAYRGVWKGIRRVQWAEERREFELKVRRCRRVLKQLITEHPDDELLRSHRERFEVLVTSRRVELRKAERRALDRVGRSARGAEYRDAVRRAA